MEGTCLRFGHGETVGTQPARLTDNAMEDEVDRQTGQVFGRIGGSAVVVQSCVLCVAQNQAHRRLTLPAPAVLIVCFALAHRTARSQAPNTTFTEVKAVPPPHLTMAWFLRRCRPPPASYIASNSVTLFTAPSPRPHGLPTRSRLHSIQILQERHPVT